MYQFPDAAQPSRQQAQRQKPRSQTLLPSQNRTTPRQPLPMVASYQQQLHRGQRSSDPTSKTLQGFYQPPPTTNPVYGTKQQGCKGTDPTFSRVAPSQGSFPLAQATGTNSYPHVQSNFEHVHYSSPYTTTRAYSREPLPEQQSSYMRDYPPLLSGPDVDTALDSSDFADGFDLDMAESFLDSSFEYQIANWQETFGDMGAGQPDQFGDGLRTSVQSADNQSHHHSGWGTDHSMTLSSSGNSLGSAFGQVLKHADQGLFPGPQPPQPTNLDRLGEASASMTLASQSERQPYDNARFFDPFADPPLSNDLLPWYQYQIHQDTPLPPSDTTWPYQTREEDPVSQDERLSKPAHPPTPHHGMSSSKSSSSSDHMPDHDLIQRFSGSKQLKNGSRAQKRTHSQLGQNPIAISRIAKKSTRENPEFFCARGCQKRVRRLSDLDRHEKTQHGMIAEEDMFRCLLCSPEKDHKYKVMYNLLAHITRVHGEVDLETHPDGQMMLKRKDYFTKVPFYRTSLGGAIMLRPNSDVAKSLADLITLHAGESIQAPLQYQNINGPGIEDPGYFDKAFQGQLEQWLLKWT